MNCALKSIKRKSWNSNVNSCTFHYQRISCLFFWGVPNVYVVSWTICFCHINQLWRYHLPAGFPTLLSQAFYLRWHPYNVKCAFNSWGEQLLSDTFYNGKRWGVLKAKTLDKNAVGNNMQIWLGNEYVCLFIYYIFSLGLDS